jgi:choline dehydrogenase-like flavoprotein
MEETEVLIIGAGASGGMAAYTLTQMGVKCTLLDAGPLIDYDKQRVLRPVSELPYRGFGKPGRFPHVTQADEFNANQWADEKENPYTYDPASPYFWVRMRLVGGKTLAWGRASWRLSDYEFKCKDHDGFGENWPIEYKDLAPFYDRVEPIFHVSGRKEGLPQLPDGVLDPDESRDSAAMRKFIAACKSKGIPTTKQRRSQGTLASSYNLLLPVAQKTGNLKLITNAVVRELSVDKKTGKVNGAHFVDRVSKREYHVKAQVVMLGASCLESTRILLNSGLANSSGVLGHYLFDQFYVKSVVTALIPGGNSRGGGYIVRFRNLDKREKNFLRGYAYDFGSGSSPGPQMFPLYGEALWKKLEETQGAGFGMTTMGEVLPRYENFVRINKLKTDAWGIPVLHITQKYTDNEFNMAKDSQQVAEELCKDSGFEVLESHWQMVPPGESIHELGTCRMGSDPKKSVLNGYNQCHDVKNLFVIDGSAFASGGAQNPTLTILALTMRASEYLVAERKKGNL